jgi:hypothetical protein
MNKNYVIFGGCYMSWWEQVYEGINIGDEFQTPGRGEEGTGRRPFKVIYKEPGRIIILTGRSCLPLEQSCFEAIQEAFIENPHSRWRVASLRENQPLVDGADRLIRERTGSNLARGNYVCAILEKIGLVRYVMQGNKKLIEKA